MSLFETGIIPLVNDYLELEAAKIRDYGNYWSASSAGYCMRKVIFDRLQVPPVTVDSRKQRVFSSGHIFHEWIQGLTKAAGISVLQETELQDEDLMIRGHFDDLVKIDDKLILYDYKTQNSQAFSWMKKQPDRKMSHYHKMQLGTYMYMLRKGDLITQPLNEARILKISKDDLRMAEEQLIYSPQLEKEVVSYWKTLNGYWNKKVVPKCTCADYEINERTGKGFMADPKYNPYFFDNEPCSIEWLKKCKKEGKVVW